MARGRAANGSGTQPRLRPDGRWEIKYTAGTDGATGKPIRKSLYGKTSDEVARKLRKVTAAIDAGTYIEPQKMTFRNWLNIWIDEYKGDVKESTRNEYRRTIKNYIVPALGGRPLCEIRPPMIQELINELARSTTIRGECMNPKTVKNVHGVLHSALKQAVQIRYIPSNPADYCSLPRIEKKEAQYMPEDNLTVFLAAIEGHRFERILKLTVFTGLREGEALGLCWDAIDFKKGTIKVKRQLQQCKGGYNLVTTKNSKSRTLTPPSYVMNLLRIQQKEQYTQKLQAGNVWNNPNGYVFTNECGRHIARNTLYMNYKRILKEAGLPQSLRFYDLRHSYAVFALEHGDNIKEIQAALGHYSSAFTADTYAHVSEQAKNASAERKDRAIQELLAK